jgi:hypothetical protein
MTTTSLTAQIEISSEAIPAIGDTILRMTDNLPTQLDPGSPGGDQVWDFTSLQAPFSQAYFYNEADSDLFPDADLVLERNGISSFYRIDDNSSAILGTYGTQGGGQLGLLLGRFQPPMIELNTPLNYMDASSQSSDLISNIDLSLFPDSILALLPIQPDSLRIVTNIDRSDMVDAWGTVLMQHQAFDVLRQRRVDEIQIKIEAQILPLPWIDVTDIVLQLLPIQIPVSDTVFSYRYLTAEQPAPIAEVFTDIDDNVLRVEYEADQFSANRKLEKKARGVYVYPNPSLSGIVRFEFFNLTPEYYQLKVYSILGKKLWSTSEFINTNKVIQADLSHLKRGTYFYSLINSRGKRIVTRRLVRITP